MLATVVFVEEESQSQIKPPFLRFPFFLSSIDLMMDVKKDASSVGVALTVTPDHVGHGWPIQRWLHHAKAHRCRLQRLSSSSVFH